MDIWYILLISLKVFLLYDILLIYLEYNDGDVWYMYFLYAWNIIMDVWNIIDILMNVSYSYTWKFLLPFVILLIFISFMSLNNTICFDDKKYRDEFSVI